MGKGCETVQKAARWAATQQLCAAGEVDKLSLEEAGFTNAVSVPNGAPEKVRDQDLPAPEDDKSFAYLWQSQHMLQQADTILLASDNDSAGHALAEELARRLGVFAVHAMRLHVLWLFGTAGSVRLLPSQCLCLDGTHHTAMSIQCML